MDAKKAMLAAAAVLVLCVFYAITQPTLAAAAVQGLLGWLKAGGDTIIAFLSNLFR